jgi:radical SAM superfamily enzyme YgiQ (UPF0313 family)
MKRPTVILAYPKIDHENNYAFFWMPFSLLTLAKPLIDSQLVEVVLFDGNQQPTSDWKLILQEHIANTICVGISIMTGGGQIGHALELARIAKEQRDCPPLVFGGPHVNVLPRQTLEHPLVDIVLTGPGQRSIPALVQALLDSLPLEQVPGLLAKRFGKPICGPVNSARSEQLACYPWELIDLPRYIRNDPTISPRTINYVSSQGCVYKCRFCYELTYQRKYSALSSEALFNDVALLRDRYGIDGIKFYDADFFVDRARALQFSERLATFGHSLAWAASINPNDLLKSMQVGSPLLDSLARSNCKRLLMGMESGADRVLADIVRKEVTRKQILLVAREISNHGILGSYTFILGFPGETEAEIQLTLQLIEELWDLDPRLETRVHIFAPYPGTPLFEDAIQAGFNPPQNLVGWSDYDYYRAQTPWVKATLTQTAREYTRMTFIPERT